MGDRATRPLPSSEIQGFFEQLASKMKVPEQMMPRFGRAGDFGGLDVDVVGRTYWYVVEERRQQIRKRLAPSPTELFYWF